MVVLPLDELLVGDSLDSFAGLPFTDGMRLEIIETIRLNLETACCFGLIPEEVRDYLSEHLSFVYITGTFKIYLKIEE